MMMTFLRVPLVALAMAAMCAAAHAETLKDIRKVSVVGDGSVSKTVVELTGQQLKRSVRATRRPVPLPKVAMAHNWVLLTLGSDPKKFSDAAASSPATGYIPPALKNQIIAATDLVGPGEKSEVTFTVPKTPGTYTYLCSFAGHYAAGMWGQLIVK